MIRQNHSIETDEVAIVEAASSTVDLFDAIFPHGSQSHAITISEVLEWNTDAITSENDEEDEEEEENVETDGENEENQNTNIEITDKEAFEAINLYLKYAQKKGRDEKILFVLQAERNDTLMATVSNKKQTVISDFFRK